MKPVGSPRAGLGLVKGRVRSWEPAWIGIAAGKMPAEQKHLSSDF